VSKNNGAENKNVKTSEKPKLINITRTTLNFTTTLTTTITVSQKQTNAG